MELFQSFPTYKYPDAERLKQLLQRPAIDRKKLVKDVTVIMQQVKEKGDEALHQYNLQFDKVQLKTLRVTPAEINEAVKKLTKADAKLVAAIKTAYANISKFHSAQKIKPQKITTTAGVECWREARPIEEVGLYIPGGSAPLFSTVIMLAVPAQLAGSRRVVVCTPAGADGKIHPAILFTAQLCGVHEIYKVGGAQAIAALAYGTQSIAAVQKIFGPGNSYVTTAKQLVQQDGVAIDMPAGPSEVMVVADKTANPNFVAADLLSQAEHGPDSQVILVSLDDKLPAQVEAAINQQVLDLPRREIAEKALKHSKIIVVKGKTEALEVVNSYAPEHLILTVKEEAAFLKGVNNAGSVFLGNYTPESAGDYASGTNHTLPTNGYAKVYGGVSLDSFLKYISFQKITDKGLAKLGPVIEAMAVAENLHAHKNAVSIRLKKQK